MAVRLGSSFIFRYTSRSTFLTLSSEMGFLALMIFRNSGRNTSEAEEEEEDQVQEGESPLIGEFTLAILRATTPGVTCCQTNGPALAVTSRPWLSAVAW